MLIISGVLVLTACGGEDSTPTRGEEATPTKGGITIKQYPEPPAMTIDADKSYVATINTNKGAISIDLFAKQTPKTVNNFVFLARDGFYNGVIFHRVITGFMIQGGDPKGDGTGGPGYSFEDEIVEDLTFNTRGLLAMANRGAGTSTNGSQFFITVAEPTHLNGNHTIFGSVVEGQEVVAAISLVPTNPRDMPTDAVVIESIVITESS